jgi:hypothetical protein
VRQRVREILIRCLSHHERKFFSVPRLEISKLGGSQCYLAKSSQCSNARNWGRIVVRGIDQADPHNRWESKSIRLTRHTKPTTVENVRVDHRRLQAAVPQQLLNRSDVRTTLQ